MSSMVLTLSDRVSGSSGMSVKWLCWSNRACSRVSKAWLSARACRRFPLRLGKTAETSATNSCSGVLG